MALTRQDIDHLADLARLDLTEEEKDRFRRQLSGVLDIDSVPLAEPNPHTMLRSDEPRPSSPREHISAPSVEENCFRGRPVFGADIEEE